MGRVYEHSGEGEEAEGRSFRETVVVLFLPSKEKISFSSLSNR